MDVDGECAQEQLANSAVIRQYSGREQMVQEHVERLLLHSKLWEKWLL